MENRTYRITFEIKEGDTVVQFIVREGAAEDVPYVHIDEENDTLRLNEIDILDANAE